VGLTEQLLSAVVTPDTLRKFDRALPPQLKGELNPKRDELNEHQWEACPHVPSLVVDW
jgi:hypothetical protein